jgi:hypothetical protein
MVMTSIFRKAEEMAVESVVRGEFWMERGRQQFALLGGNDEVCAWRGIV